MSLSECGGRHEGERTGGGSAVAAALLSAREDAALPTGLRVFGEISLSGALRPVGQSENRLKEAAKLGFTSAIVPEGSKTSGTAGLALNPMADLSAFVGETFGARGDRPI